MVKQQFLGIVVLGLLFCSNANAAEKSNVFCIKSSTHKLMYLKTPNEWLFFDLQNDPYETSNIFTGNSEIEKKMKEKLIGWINRED